MLLNDDEIRKLCTAPVYTNGHGPMIEPFVEFWPYVEQKLPAGAISYGLDHAGYCLRLDTEILIFKPSYGEAIDPKRFGDAEYKNRMFDRLPINCGTCGKSRPLECGGCKVVIPPHSYVLGTSYEYLRIPKHIKGRCVGKSTLARAGILINTTPLEPGWEGNLTLEIGNVTPCAAVLHIMEGIAQLEFELLTAPPLVDYKQKGGKYQSQRGVTPAVVL